MPIAGPLLADSSSSPRLPFDVLELVLEESDKLEDPTRKDGSACCLVHPALLPAAQRRLYSSLSAAYWSKAPADGNEAEVPGVQLNDGPLRCTLADSTHLGQHARSMHLRVDFTEHYGMEHATEMEQSMGEIIGACPNVTELSIEQHGENEAPDDVAAIVAQSSWAGRLRSLQLDYTGEGAVELLTKAQQLRSLTLDGSGSITDFFFPDAGFSFALNHLSLQLQSPHIFLSLIRNSVHTLTSLETNTWALNSWEAHHALSAMSALRTLHLSTLDMANNTEIQALAMATGLFPNLQDLTLHALDSVSLSDPPHPLPPFLLPNLPASLTILDISHIPVHPALIVRMFNHQEATIPRNLREIVFPKAVERAIEGEEGEEKVWWDTVVGCCKVNGVKASAPRR